MEYADLMPFLNSRKKNGIDSKKMFQQKFFFSFILRPLFYFSNEIGGKLIFSRCDFFYSYFFFAAQYPNAVGENFFLRPAAGKNVFLRPAAGKNVF